MCAGISFTTLSSFGDHGAFKTLLEIFHYIEEHSKMLSVIHKFIQQTSRFCLFLRSCICLLFHFVVRKIFIINDAVIGLGSIVNLG